MQAFLFSSLFLFPPPSSPASQSQEITFCLCRVPHPLTRAHRGGDSVNVSGSVNKSCPPHLLHWPPVPYIPEHFLFIYVNLLYNLTAFFACSCLVFVLCLILQSCSEPLFNISPAALHTYLLCICSLITGFVRKVIFTWFFFGAKS